MSNTKCPFDVNAASFVGSPLDQAKCLLRFVKRQGNVDDQPVSLPDTLTNLLSNPDRLGFSKSALRTLLAARGELESNFGGSLDNTICRANNNDEEASFANYFVIHDTSDKLSSSQTFDPGFINTRDWSANHLEDRSGIDCHVALSRDGRSRTYNDYGTPWRATQFEIKHPGYPNSNAAIHKGRFLHHEMVQPRKGPGSSDADSPDPGFTTIQYEMLAMCYLCASLRRGRWMIPLFHCVLDLGVGDHDDPQRFDLARWDQALKSLLNQIQTSPSPSPTVQLRSLPLKDDPTLAKVANGLLTLAATGGLVKGIGPVQDALNLLATDTPEFGIQLGGNRGFFGPRTAKAVQAFQHAKSLAESGKVDAQTVFALDGAVVDYVATHGDGEDFSTPASSSTTQDGSGGSTTTGLHGRITKPSPGVEVTTATETMTAKRDSQSLGPPKSVQQVRTHSAGVTTVSQPNYCWKDRTLPDAVLVDQADGLSNSEGAFSGKATFFGKGDNQDEGTGAPTFGLVQTDSSVFGISLPKQRLLDEGLATLQNGIVTATDKGLSALVEVFFPDTGRLAKLPLVDIGPGPSTHAAADLTVAASCFLQKLTEDQIRNLDNIQVQMRVV